MKRSYPVIRTQAFKNASRGLFFFFQENHSRIHLIMMILTFIVAFIIQVSSTQWCILLLCTGLVLSVEALNSALEHLTDLVSPEWNPKAGLVKDTAAGAVLLCSIFAAMVGLIILVPESFDFLYEKTGLEYFKIT